MDTLLAAYHAVSTAILNAFIDLDPMLGAFGLVIAVGWPVLLIIIPLAIGLWLAERRAERAIRTEVARRLDAVKGEAKHDPQ